MLMKFKLVSDYKPAGDQPSAIAQLCQGLFDKKQYQTLLGVTGSGKTFTMANVIEQVQRPTMVIAHNKTLAAQLYSEFKSFFPHNAVEYFVSYYDYYQPEAYVVSTDTYIDKDSSINEEIERLRLAATTSLLDRRDVIIVASVSCIYGLGSPEAYHGMVLTLDTGNEYSFPAISKQLIKMQYSRNEMDFQRGTFRIRGDIFEIIPAYQEGKVVRLNFFGEELEEIHLTDPITGNIIESVERITIYPASHYVIGDEVLDGAIEKIKVELKDRIAYFNNNKKYLESQRIEQRTNYDIEMMNELGYCTGIENYSRYIDGRSEGEAPPTLLDYLPKDGIIMIDESHVMIPQLHGMYKGDRSRKTTLVEHGFRLPSALDNRPLNFDEFMLKENQMLFISATPAEFEVTLSEGHIVEQVVRPTGLVDPEIIIKPVKGQVDDLINEIRNLEKTKGKVLVTTLTKRFSEDLTDYLSNVDIRVKYLHSDISTLERIEIIRELRLDNFDVLIGINLLREGLDIPEVSLVAILDADKEGFLRSETSLIQTVGRAARNVEGRVIMYADQITGSMQRAIEETNRRREKQLQYNKENNITPKTIYKKIEEATTYSIKKKKKKHLSLQEKQARYNVGAESVEEEIKRLTKMMHVAAEKLEFETAAEIRDMIKEISEE
ncbi:MAG: excinuclease ABC subunit UvrB [Nitrospinae bacterium]|nr:excinuclease ABC subunit UvrB [Nitrospinota bacterium]